MEGRWDTPDLTALLTLLARNHAALELAFYGRWWQQLAFRLRHWRRANTRRQAKRNIVAHYDLGNDFYQRWLDPTMTYSSALFDGDFGQSTAAAQDAKYRRILAELDLPPGAHILEIGCGWGGFAEVAGRAGYRVTGLSLSDAQTAYARERIARAGLGERVRFHLRDYRDETGTYDGVASIEMFEAVGEKWWPTYFDTVRRVLAPGGRASIQTITIADARFERYRSAVRLHPAAHLSRRHAGLAVALPRRGGVRGTLGPQRPRLRPRLCRDAAPLARRVRPRSRCHPRAGFPRALHPLLALLPRLLRRRLRQRLDRCVAVHAGCRLV